MKNYENRLTKLQKQSQNDDLLLNLNLLSKNAVKKV